MTRPRRRPVRFATLLSGVLWCAACPLVKQATSSSARPDAGGRDCDPLHGGRYPRAPVNKPLHEICGIASTRTDLPLGTDPVSVAKRQGYFHAAVELGGLSIRRDFRWSEVEPAKGSFQFAGYDRLVDEAQQQNIRLLGTLDYGNPWATSVPNADEFFPPDDVADFANYARVTAEHFRGRVDQWEIWNEPNAGFRFWKGTELTGDPYAYADLLAAAYDGVKAGNPDAQVLLGGTVFTPQFIDGAMVWLDAAYRHRADLAEKFDVAGIHTYQSYPPTVGPEVGQGNGLAEDLSLVGKIQAHACMLAQHGVPQRPVVITELGWPVYQNVDEDEQARFTVRAALLAARAGVSGIYWYVLRDGRHPETYPPEDAFGLLHNDGDFANGREGTPKRVYLALKSMNALTLGGSVVDVLPQVTGLPVDGHAVAFSSGVVALWTEGSHANVTSTQLMNVVYTMYQQPQCAGLTSSEPLHADIGPDVSYVLPANCAR